MIFVRPGRNRGAAPLSAGAKRKYVHTCPGRRNKDVRTKFHVPEIYLVDGLVACFPTVFQLVAILGNFRDRVVIFWRPNFHKISTRGTHEIPVLKRRLQHMSTREKASGNLIWHKLNSKFLLLFGDAFSCCFSSNVS